MRTLLVALLVMCPPAGATWSIVLTDEATGEVAIGSATCLEGLNLKALLPVLRVGVGAGAAQSAIDQGAVNRKKMWDELIAGTPPVDIVPILLEDDLFAQSRQYGIANLSDPAATFTGTNAGAFADGLVGQTGTVRYAIQGNVLTGMPVIAMAESAVVNTPGPLIDKLMAGMEAARLMGGDGRCSCPDGAPTDCGSPPPEFDKSAHIGFMVVSRLGDVDGICSASGCANGQYWFVSNVKDQFDADPDPVLQMQDDVDAFKAGLAGRADGLASTWMLSREEVVGTGSGTVLLDVAPFDFFGDPVPAGGLSVIVSHAEDSAGLSEIRGVSANPDGTFTVQLDVGTGVGEDRFVVVVDDGLPKPATLAPFPTLLYREALITPADSLSAAAGGSAGLDLLGPVGDEGRGYLVLLSVSGTSPGLALPNVTVPLVDDLALGLSASFPNVAPFTDTLGTLGPDGAAAAAFEPAPGQLAPLVGAGLDLHFAWITLSPIDFASNPVTIAVDP